MVMICCLEYKNSFKYIRVIPEFAINHVNLDITGINHADYLVADLEYALTSIVAMSECAFMVFDGAHGDCRIGHGWERAFYFTAV